MGRPPRECGVRPNVLVTCVAFHPGALIVAIGYDDGWIMLIRLTDAAEILVRRTGDADKSAISALAWDGAGARLVFGARDGAAGVLSLPG